MIEVVALGAILGVLITVSGVGAGVVTTPALILVAGLDPLSAVATGALFSALLKIAIAAQHLRARRMSWPDTWVFLRVAVPVTLVIALATGALYSRGYRALINDVTSWAVIGCGLVALASLYSSVIGTWIARAGRSAAAVTTGLFVGATGVGGGIFVVPALVRAHQLDVKRAVATSIPIGLILSFSVSLGLSSNGITNYLVVVWAILGGALSLPFASWLFRVMSPRVVKLTTSVLILLSILTLIVRVLGE